ncbi:SymE family type I addiction module toxin [Citrobacter freundii]
MADSHSTPDSDQSGTERSVIVGYRPNVFDKSTPKIILSGKWLRAAGFDTGQQITVKVMNGCIVLMVYGEQEQRLQDELQEANQKLNRIESTLATLQWSTAEPVSVTYRFTWCRMALVLIRPTLLENEAKV